ncbi:unnamed protein product [Periconia digitata]|uniref:Heterokaryon incompatibility domain-containing protein n=1 Tax=Periconia digitata TaxID=1303443 RepID=A0A9W4UNM6_9PLEO|nr:unnamed protein product [Periconia digitata]
MDSWNSEVARDLYAPLQGVLPIRLLEISPGSASESLHCRLIPTTIEAAQGQFEATSYTWGSPVDPCTIDCNGYPLKIQQNAYYMLMHLRQRDQLRTVWIDAICINQGDIPERSSQVSAMHLVYSFAKSVVIWLGPSDESSRIAMRFAARLDAPKFQREYEHHNRTSLEIVEEIPRKTYIFDPEANPDIGLSREIITSSVNFISRPWFGRVWVLQEAAGCRETQVQCGKDEIEWNQLFSLAWIMRSESPGRLPPYLPDTFPIVQRKAFAILKMHDIRSYRFPPSERVSHFRKDFSTILSSAHLHEATDPRDKIYSAMNLSIARDRIMDTKLFFHREEHSGVTGYANWGLKVDYTIPWEILYAEVSLELYKRGYVSFVADSGRNRQPAGWELPSWMVDFREQPSNTEIAESADWKAGGRCRSPNPIPNARNAVKFGFLPKAHRRVIDVSHMSKEFKTCKKSLMRCLDSFIGLQSLMRDEIVWTGEVSSDIKESDPRSNKESKSQCILRFISQESDQAMSAPTRIKGHYMTGEPVLSAYKMAIILGMDHMSDRVDEEFVRGNWDAFISWLKLPATDEDNETTTEQSLPPYELASAASSVWFDTRFAITTHGYFCLVPALTRPGDTVVIIRGHHLPLVLRPYVSPNRKIPIVTEYFESIGSAYVHGMMDNEAKCIVDEFGYKENMTDVRRQKLEDARAMEGDVWGELGFGDYSAVLETIGPSWVNIV